MRCTYILEKNGVTFFEHSSSRELGNIFFEYNLLFHRLHLATIAAYNITYTNQNLHSYNGDMK